MRANESDLKEKKDDTPTRPVCGWAGVSLSTYKRLTPWCKKPKETEDKSVSSIKFGGGFMAFELTAPTVIVDSVKNKINQVTERTNRVLSIFKKRQVAEAPLQMTETTNEKVEPASN